MVLEVERKESKTGKDWLLMMQYRTQVVIKSFTTNYNYSSEKGALIPVTIVNVPGTYSEELYFLQKEGLSISLYQVKFSKEEKESVKCFHEFKSNKINMFTHHEGKFYLMDETCIVKTFTVD